MVSRTIVAVTFLLTLTRSLVTGQVDGANSTLVGTNYCTYGFNFDCWEGGRPSCCLDDNAVCPTEQPACSVDGANPTLVGDNYCTFAVDFDCWENGRPSCCLDDTCPTEQPGCDVSTLVASWNCTFGFQVDRYDFTCWEGGKPSCCLDDSDCPIEEPACDDGKSGTGPVLCLASLTWVVSFLVSCLFF